MGRGIDHAIGATKTVYICYSGMSWVKAISRPSVLFIPDVILQSTCVPIRKTPRTQCGYFEFKIFRGKIGYLLLHRKRRLKSVPGIEMMFRCKVYRSRENWVPLGKPGNFGCVRLADF
jgi:hypothetical protein